MILKPTVLKAFTTFAPDAHCAAISPAEVEVPTSSPVKSGRKGLSASIRILPVRLPAPARESLAAGHGVASSITSHLPAASATLPALADGPASPSSFFISSDSGWRELNITVWPLRAQRLPSVPPTLPEPMIAIFIVLTEKQLRIVVQIVAPIDPRMAAFAFVIFVFDAVRIEYLSEVLR